MAPAAGAQTPAPRSAPEACPAQPRYPLPSAARALRELSLQLEDLSQDARCLNDAHFHAWRGAVLMSLGRPAEALEPLERALLTNPELFGAQMDLAQAMVLQGDAASAAALLEDLRRRAEIPQAMRQQLDREIAGLRAPVPSAPSDAPGSAWHSSWQVASMGGYDSNLNNAPSATEITLTLPERDVTLPLDPASRPKRGGALLTTAQWQGLRPQGESVWALQAEVRARHTGESDTGYQQTDLGATWLESPLAASQWVARLGASYFGFGGNTLLWATRASLQYQWEGKATGLGGIVANCRPTAGLELERRLYPSTRNIDGMYRGGTAGVLCRPATKQALTPPVLSLQARLGDERPFDADRAGGVYRRAEVRGQWEGRLPAALGDFTLRWATTHQADSEPYSVLLGNLARRTLRHTFQFETSWPLGSGLSLISNAEASHQRSNLRAFDSRQVGFYLGLRWDSM